MTGDTQPNQRYQLPPRLSSYRKIGPFDAESLPPGLLREHRLKEGTWANLTVMEGEIGFVWDDADSDGAVTILVAGDRLHVPPLILHHLELREETFSLEIEFLTAS